MRVIHKSDLVGTEREVVCPKGGFTSLRILLEKDGMGFTLTHTSVPVGAPQHWHYKDHLEACYCITGYGSIKELKTGKSYRVFPGTTYILDEHDDHEFQAFIDTVLICVFNPPLLGREVHQQDGSYSIEGKVR